MIKISRKRYAELLKAEYTLESLEAGGVDNWINYDNAMNEESEDMPSANEFNSWNIDRVISYWGERD